jgi:poly-gamma-glutamate synthase PgsB/CapB
MPGIETLAIITAALLLIWVIEARRHLRQLAKIPVRIHVNGTRGKSSVTRLIAGGLRAGGLRTCAKVTGTQARMILPTGEEVPVFRPARANVMEQKRIVRAAAELEAEVLLIECMALQPELQWLSEAWFVRATHGVITNARPDHLDVMGPTPDDVARALAGMIPPKQRLYTCEQTRLPILAHAAQDRATTLIALNDADSARITNEDLAGFSYLEHPENVALALRICADLGVDRAVALKGMWDANPDSGAMRAYTILRSERRLQVINGFAANDPESTQTVWAMSVARHPACTQRVALFNARRDRADRSRQMGEAVATWPEADLVVAMGGGTGLFLRAARTAGMHASKLLDLEDQPIEAILEAIAQRADTPTLVICVGNIGGPGMQLIDLLDLEDAA